MTRKLTKAKRRRIAKALADLATGMLGEPPTHWPPRTEDEWIGWSLRSISNALLSPPKRRRSEAWGLMPATAPRMRWDEAMEMPTDGLLASPPLAAKLQRDHWKTAVGIAEEIKRSVLGSNQATSEPFA